MTLSQAALVRAADEPAPPVLIFEVQPETTTSATEELVRLYNPRDTEVDVTDWRVQYRSAANQSDSAWATKATLSCKPPSQPNCRVVMPANSLLTLASYDVGEEAYALASGMALGGGQVRLVQPPAPAQPQVIHDLVGYGSAVVAEGQAAVAPQKGLSIQRRVNQQGQVQDTNDNWLDFMLNQPDEPAPDPDEQPDTSTPPSYLQVFITELLPDPAAPADDETDEFIELYNPNNTPLNLKGYVLQAGSNWRYTFVLPELIMPPLSYLVLRAEQTGLTLSNSGTGARVLNPGGAVVDEVASYGQAETGQSWARLENGQWRWSLQPTPGEANVLVEEPPKISTAAVPKAKKAVAKKPAVPKAKSASQKAPKPPKAPKTVAAKPAEQPAQAKKDPNLWLIGSVAAMAGGYALYEYRNDALGTLRRIREASKKAK